MKSKKIFSIILSLSLMSSGASFCFAQEEGRKFDKDAFYKMQSWADGYNKNCTLSDNNDYTKCTFDDEKNEKIELIKFKNGDFKISNSTDVFANDNGDNIWIYNGETKFYQIKEGLITREKLIGLLLNWGILGNNLKKKLNLKNKEEIMHYNFNDVHKFWSWWYIPIAAGIYWLGNLIYKNYKLYKSNKEKENINAQRQVIYYPFNDVNSNPDSQDGQKKITQEGHQEDEKTQQENEEPSKDEKTSDPVSNEKKEDTSKSEEKSSTDDGEA